MTTAAPELARYLELTPKSRALWEEAKNYLPGGDSRNSIFWNPYPVFITDAQGCRVTDADGVERLDFINTMTTMILGHGPAAVNDAVQKQLARGVGYNAPNPHQIRLAKLLCERVPSFDLARFTNSGTEATLNTIRAARAFTGRSKIAKAEGGYHGTHDVVSVSVRGFNPAAAGNAAQPRAIPSTAGLGDETLEQVVIFPFNDAASARRVLEAHRGELAAVIVEPIMGSAGMVPAAPEFLAALRDFTREDGSLLIFDEVISFRVAPGGAQEYYGIKPDLTALGKIIGGGFPIGAFGGRREIMELYDPTRGPKVSHAGTFNGNPITTLAGAVTLEQLTPEVYRRLAELTETLRQGVRRVCAELEIPVQVTGLGSLFGIHLIKDAPRNYREIMTVNQQFRHEVFLGLLNEGVLTASNLVGCLSTAITEAEIDAFLAALRRVLVRAR